MQVWNVLHAARWKCRTQKNRHLVTIAQLCRAISSQLRHISAIGKNLLSSNISSTCSHNMANFGPLADEIVSLVWGTPANFNGFRVLWALLHGTAILGVSQTLRRWTEGAAYVWQGGHHVGHWPTFLVVTAVIAGRFLSALSASPPTTTCCRHSQCTSTRHLCLTFVTVCANSEYFSIEFMVSSTGHWQLVVDDVYLSGFQWEFTWFPDLWPRRPMQHRRKQLQWQYLSNQTTLTGWGNMWMMQMAVTLDLGRQACLQLSTRACHPTGLCCWWALTWPYWLNLDYLKPCYVTGGSFSSLI